VLGTRWYNNFPSMHYTDPDSHSAQPHRQTDSQTDRQTVLCQWPIILRGAAVRSAKNNSNTV